MEPHSSFIFVDLKHHKCTLLQKMLTSVNFSLFCDTFFARQTGVFDWSNDLQGVILSAFAYGYTAVMPFGGYIVTRFGGKSIIFLFMLTASVLTLLSPIGATTSPYLFLAVESVKGIFIVRFLFLKHSPVIRK